MPCPDMQDIEEAREHPGDKDNAHSLTRQLYNYEKVQLEVISCSWLAVRLQI